MLLTGIREPDLMRRKAVIYRILGIWSKTVMLIKLAFMTDSQMRSGEWVVLL